MAVYLKPKNQKEIVYFFTKNGATNIQGTKLFALMKLIKSKGETIIVNPGDQTSCFREKALLLPNGKYILFKKTSIPSGHFQLKTYYLEKNGK